MWFVCDTIAGVSIATGFAVENGTKLRAVGFRIHGGRGFGFGGWQARALQYNRCSMTQP